MTLPDSGKVEDYSEAEMNELLGKFETDKASLSKIQKAAVARYNFKKGKGEPITYRGEGAAPAADATPDKKAPAPSAGPGDIIAMLPPEVQVLAGKDPASLTKEEKITLAKAKSQAVRAQAAAKKAEGGGEPDKPKGPSPEELAAKKALEIPSAKRIQERFGGEQKAITAWGMMVDTPTATVTAERILDVARYLHIEMGFDFLQNLTAVDYPTERIEVVYNLLNMGTKEQFALKVKLPRDAPEGHDMPYLPSIVSVHKGADWLEREVFDLFGIRFTGHPYMRRIMMPDTWNGHPLRKDYDLTKEQYIGMDAAGNDVVSYKEADGW